jgi:dolichol-phosphate mannosyltransferase
VGGHDVKLSVVVPAHNEAGSIEASVHALTATLEREDIDHEIIVVDDASDDGTGPLVEAIAEHNSRVLCVRSHPPNGFGFAVRSGLDVYTGDAVAIFMADLSDDPEDLVLYYQILVRGYDCAFGSRFLPGAKVHEYPRLKLVVNRVANAGIRLLFRHGYNDTTNAFKAYRREVIDTIQPLLSNHFNLTVEMPLKAIVRGHSYAVVPISWRNRSAGSSKLSVPEMGSRYLFIVLYTFLEHHLSRGDYRRPGFEPPQTRAVRRRRAPSPANGPNVEAEKHRRIRS